ncbi:unnamed protein product [Lactuca virosa]|uniref:Uncharacterized protein n=1 Tax=Lactuca virosa TaxID=75947 RepID=A0AAU9PEV5_9ASTR|nr:unnamed protein product [Lactuca virosa]
MIHSGSLITISPSLRRDIYAVSTDCYFPKNPPPPILSSTLPVSLLFIHTGESFPEIRTELIRVVPTPSPTGSAYLPPPAFSSTYALWVEKRRASGKISGLELNGDHERTIVGPLRFSGAPNSPLLLLQTSFTRLPIYCQICLETEIEEIEREIFKVDRMVLCSCTWYKATNGLTLLFESSEENGPEALSKRILDFMIFGWNY